MPVTALECWTQKIWGFSHNICITKISEKLPIAQINKVRLLVLANSQYCSFITQANMSNSNNCKYNFCSSFCLFFFFKFHIALCVDLPINTY